MNTFLPYPSFDLSASVLDQRRLGKQRVEVYQIYRTLVGQSKGWRNHPAVLMWKGYEYSLLTYGMAMCLEWRRRGFKDSLLDRFWVFRGQHKYGLDPEWLGGQEFHSSHRAALLDKDWSWYRQFGWNESPERNYVWPVRIGTN